MTLDAETALARTNMSLLEWLALPGYQRRARLAAAFPGAVLTAADLDAVDRHAAGGGPRSLLVGAAVTAAALGVAAWVAAAVAAGPRANPDDGLAAVRDLVAARRLTLAQYVAVEHAVAAGAAARFRGGKFFGNVLVVSFPDAAAERTLLAPLVAAGFAPTSWGYAELPVPPRANPDDELSPRERAALDAMFAWPMLGGDARRAAKARYEDLMRGLTPAEHDRVLLARAARESVKKRDAGTRRNPSSVPFPGEHHDFLTREQSEAAGVSHNDWFGQSQAAYTSIAGQLASEGRRAAEGAADAMRGGNGPELAVHLGKLARVDLAGAYVASIHGKYRADWADPDHPKGPTSPGSRGKVMSARALRDYYEQRAKWAEEYFDMLAARERRIASDPSGALERAFGGGGQPGPAARLAQAAAYYDQAHSFYAAGDASHGHGRMSDANSEISGALKDAGMTPEFEVFWLVRFDSKTSWEKRVGALRAREREAVRQTKLGRADVGVSGLLESLDADELNDFGRKELARLAPREAKRLEKLAAKGPLSDDDAALLARLRSLVPR